MSLDCTYTFFYTFAQDFIRIVFTCTAEFYIVPKHVYPICTLELKLGECYSFIILFHLKRNVVKII